MVRPFDPKSSWSSDSDNVLEEFYKPALTHCKKYDRLAGYFSSTSFVITIRETLDFIKRGGMMRLVTSADLSKMDVETISKNIQNPDTLAADIKREIDGASGIEQKCMVILGWMLANSIDGRPQLEIKIAIPKNRGIFHPKIGIFTMNNEDVVSFSGSVNETSSAWRDNIEDFKVFTSWDEKNLDYIEHDKKQFEKFYNNQSTHVDVYDLPDAVRNHLLKIRPKSKQEFDKLTEELEKELYMSDSQDDSKSKKGIELRDYQNDAIINWESNNFCGIFEMATGTGKTFTALGGIERLCKKEKRLLVIIVAPQKHITTQWIENIREWDRKSSCTQKLSQNIVEAYSDNPDWKHDLGKKINDFNMVLFSGNFCSDFCVIFTTYNTLSSVNFIERINKAKNSKILLIADEVHTVGSPEFRKGLIEKYDYRLGLSATPFRHYDEEGTDKILAYFIKIVYQMTIKTAIEKKYLVPYEYHPEHIDLDDGEMESYIAFTIKIAKLYATRKKALPIEKISIDLKIKNLQIQRKEIVAMAKSKYAFLERLLDRMNNKIEDTLIYCHKEEQLNKITEILSKRDIVNTSITFIDPTDDRTRIIKQFTNHHYPCITAIRCLDEGVDIPSARMAIIMASTGNPRQYIQRRGRILRPNPITGKEDAKIFDILVKPPTKDNYDDELPEFEHTLVIRELLRHKEFADIAKNREHAYEKINNIAKQYGVDLEKLSDA